MAQVGASMAEWKTLFVERQNGVDSRSMPDQTPVETRLANFSNWQHDLCQQ